MAYVESNGHVTMTSRDSERSSRDPNTMRIQYLENSQWRCYLATIASY